MLRLLIVQQEHLLIHLQSTLKTERAEVSWDWYRSSMRVHCVTVCPHSSRVPHSSWVQVSLCAECWLFLLNQLWSVMQNCECECVSAGCHVIDMTSHTAKPSVARLRSEFKFTMTKQSCYWRYINYILNQGMVCNFNQKLSQWDCTQEIKIQVLLLKSRKSQETGSVAMIILF